MIGRTDEVTLQGRLEELIAGQLQEFEATFSQQRLGDMRYGLCPSALRHGGLKLLSDATATDFDPPSPTAKRLASS